MTFPDLHGGVLGLRWRRRGTRRRRGVLSSVQPGAALAQRIGKRYRRHPREAKALLAEARQLVAQVPAAAGVPAPPPGALRRSRSAEATPTERHAELMAALKAPLPSRPGAGSGARRCPGRAREK